MKTTDYLVKSMTKDGKFRAYAVNATQVVQKAHEIHDTWSASSAALGRTLIGTILLATPSLQGEAGMTVKIQGNGPVGFIIADGTAEGTVKGYMGNPHVSLPANDKGKIDVAKAIGNQGTLSVTKMAPGDKTPYTGEVNLVSGELGDDFTYYLAQSEEISKLEKTLKSLPLVSQMLRDGDTPEDILKKIFGDDLKILETMPVRYACDCSKERFAHALASISKDDMKKLIDEDHHAEAVCQFCGKKYEFNEDELKKIYAEMTANDDKKSTDEK